ncbi:hypothetical protein Hanom_Chr09g00769481 [Helianthus anomalus]
MEPFKDMAKFLRESRIAKAFTDRTKVYESHVRMFWKSVRYDECEKMIYSAVQKKYENAKDIDIEVKFNVGEVRRVLDLGDSDNDPTTVPERLCKGLWFRMGFSGHVNGKYLKSMFSRPYKFLVHCVLHALSHRKGAYDEPSDYIMNIITCLVLNRPYNISQVIFDHMVDNVKGEKYIMYPRFIKMLIDDQVRDLPKDPADELNLHHMKSEALSRLNQYKGLKKDEPEPRTKRLICKIENRNYVALENDAWRHGNSNSEDETDSLRDMHEKKLRYWFIKDGKRKRTPKVSLAVTAPKRTTPKIVVKGPSKKKSPLRLVDETVIDPTGLVQQGIDLMKESLDDFIKRNEEAQAEKAAKAVESSAKNTEAESVKQKEAEGVAHTDSSDADDESTDTKPDIDTSKIGGSDEEDSTYIPMPQAEKKKGALKRKANPQGIIPRRVRARKGSASVHETRSGKSEKHIQTPEVQAQSIPEILQRLNWKRVDKPDVEKKGDDEDEVEITGERVSTPPPPPENPTIHIPDDPKQSPPKKDTTSGLFEGFPNVQGEFTDNILSEGEYDMFHDATIKDLTKKVSILEKEKAKAEAERDKLKKKLEKAMKLNEEMKTVVNDHAERIDALTEDVADNAKLFDQLTNELSKVNARYENMNETNQMLHQMLDDLHEASSNESKVLKLEVEALRADKVVKDEQLNMLYAVVEHKLGIDVQVVYNDLEIQRVEHRRIAREKELAKEPEGDVEMVDAGVNEAEHMDVDQDPSFVLVSDSVSLSYRFDDIIRLVKVEQRKRKMREPEIKLLRWKEDKVKEKNEEEDLDLDDWLDVIENFDPKTGYDDDKDQGGSGLLVKPLNEICFDDYLNDQLNEQPEDTHREGSSSRKQHSDQVFHTQSKVIYLHSTFEGEIEVPRTRAEMLEELGLDDENLKFDIEDEISSSPKKEYEFKLSNEADNFDHVEIEEGSDTSKEDMPYHYSGVYAIRRELGVQYFQFLSDIKTLPWWDVEELVQTKNIKQFYHGLDVKVHDQKLWKYIKHQTKNRFPYWKPQFPKQDIKIDPVTGEKDMTLIIKPPRCL